MSNIIDVSVIFQVSKVQTEKTCNTYVKLYLIISESCVWLKLYTQTANTKTDMRMNYKGSGGKLRWNTLVTYV